MNADDVAAGPGPVPWQEAWAAALYGPDGFYRRSEGPAGHFRTASHAAPGPLARAVARLAAQAGCTGVVDVGAGRGELLSALAALPVDDGRPPLRLHGCDVVDRPAALPAGVGWTPGLDALLATPEGVDDPLDGALVVGWELLDVVPCPVVEVGPDGAVHEVLVDRSGAESPGGPPAPDDAAWLARWWPLDGARPGSRAEVGRPREETWTALARRCAGTPAGAVLLAVDYAHTRDARPSAGTLAGYRDGALVGPRPDGSCDVTAHVALDAVGAALAGAGCDVAPLTTQRDSLLALGTTTGPLPLDAPGAVLLQALAERSAVAELLDPAGLGAFSWLLAGAGRPAPRPAGDRRPSTAPARP